MNLNAAVVETLQLAQGSTSTSVATAGLGSIGTGPGQANISNIVSSATNAADLVAALTGTSRAGGAESALDPFADGKPILGSGRSLLADRVFSEVSSFDPFASVLALTEEIGLKDDELKRFSRIRSLDGGDDNIEIALQIVRPVTKAYQASSAFDADDSVLIVEVVRRRAAETGEEAREIRPVVFEGPADVGVPKPPESKRSLEMRAVQPAADTTSPGVVAAVHQVPPALWWTAPVVVVAGAFGWLRWRRWPGSRKLPGITTTKESNA